MCHGCEEEPRGGGAAEEGGGCWRVRTWTLQRQTCDNKQETTSSVTLTHSQKERHTEIERQRKRESESRRDFSLPLETL